MRAGGRLVARGRLGLAVAFASAARSYWLDVFPCARHELCHWRLRACEIPDPELRRLACEAQRTKRESLEGAVVFATLAPRVNRQTVVRAITAYQVAFDYLDEISEQPGGDPIANGRQLNQALVHALEPRVPHAGSEVPDFDFDYYSHSHQREDGGYLRDLVDTCRTALQALPSYAAIAESVRRITTRMVVFQSLNHGDGNGSFDAFARWARAETKQSTGLRWWETGAAAGSPFPVFALIAAAAKPTTEARDAAAVEDAYFPWVASLSLLLDSLVDRQEDCAGGQRSLIDYYDSPAEVVTGLQNLATRAVDHTNALSDGDLHAMILAAMASFFHAATEGSEPETYLVTQRVLDAMVPGFVLPATLMLRTLRGFERIALARGRVAHALGRNA